MPVINVGKKFAQYLGGFHPQFCFLADTENKRGKNAIHSKTNRKNKRKKRRAKRRYILHVMVVERIFTVDGRLVDGTQSGDIIEGYNTASLSMTLASYKAVWSGVGDVIPIAGYTITFGDGGSASASASPATQVRSATD